MFVNFLMFVNIYVVGASLDQWWNEQAPATFAHVAYNGKLRSEHDLVKRWETSWLVKWSRLKGELKNGTWLNEKRVGDYGIGGGLLGKVLCTKFSIRSYVGMDVAMRSLAAAAKTMEKCCASCSTSLVLITGQPEFKDLSLDVLVSQQVIQHFPSRDYTKTWLQRVESARIPDLYFEVRHADPPIFNDWSGNTTGSSSLAVTFAVLTNCKWMNYNLPSYRLLDSWFTTKGSRGTKFQACAFELRSSKS